MSECRITAGQRTFSGRKYCLSSYFAHWTMFVCAQVCCACTYVHACVWLFVHSYLCVCLYLFLSMSVCEKDAYTPITYYITLSYYKDLLTGLARYLKSTCLLQWVCYWQLTQYQWYSHCHGKPHSFVTYITTRLASLKTFGWPQALKSYLYCDIILMLLILL